MAQWLVRYTSSGFSETKAAMLMSICAVVGIFGSVVAGYLENKLGTKKGYSLLAIIFATAFILNFTNVLPLMYLSVPMFGLCITLFQIYMPAFEITVFGRDNFKKVNSLIFPVACMCGQAAFLVIALCIKLFGEVRSAYMVFALLLILTVMLAMTLKAETEME
jgi:MFS family permease